jgi:hypothetical protein
VLDNSRHTQNNMGGENVVIYAFQKVQGYHVSNPCHDIWAFHAHCSNERDYDNRGQSISNGRYGTSRAAQLEGVEDDVWKMVF